MDRGGRPMLLQSIKLENFRQFVNEKIDFSTDPDRNVTLIIGENGTGKTTFEQSFFWCLYGETDFTDKSMLNRTIAEKMIPDQKVTVRVELKLMHGSASYEIVRTQEYKKTYGNKIVSANSVLNIAVKSADGNTRYLKPLECETEIKKILPKELSNYFFFDGERIEKMSKEIASGKKSSSFANAVVGLTGLNAIQAAINHLSPTRSHSVIGKFNEEYVGDSAGKILELTKAIDSLQEELNKINNRLEEIDDEIDAATISKKKLEDEIKKYADGEAWQNEKERLIKEITAAKKMKAHFVKQICTFFNDNMTAFFSMSLTYRALDILSHSDFSGKDIPEMHSKTIEYLINRGTCICGTQLMEGTIPYKNVTALMDYLPPQSIGVTVGQFIKESRSLYNKPTDLYYKIIDTLSLISEQDDIIAKLNEDLTLVTSKLDGDDVREQVKKISTQIRAFEKTIQERKEEQRNLYNRQGAADKEKSLKETSRSELSLLSSNNRRIERLKAYALRIYNDLSEEYQEKEKEIRKKLESTINEIFKTIYNGGLSISIDDKYNISVYVTDYDGEVETSTAQSISVIFAFISAIIKMARDNQKENKNEAYSEPYPLVMDAPLSAFDKRRIKSICSAIPETAEQVIIFIKDTDGDLAEEYLGTKVMKRHYFEKIDEFNTRLILGGGLYV